MSKILRLTEEQLYRFMVRAFNCGADNSEPDFDTTLHEASKLSASNVDPVREAAEDVVKSYVEWTEDRGLREPVKVQEVDEDAIRRLEQALKGNKE